MNTGQVFNAAEKHKRQSPFCSRKSHPAPLPGFLPCKVWGRISISYSRRPLRKKRNVLSCSDIVRQHILRNSNLKYWPSTLLCSWKGNVAVANNASFDSERTHTVAPKLQPIRSKGTIHLKIATKQQNPKTRCMIIYDSQWSWKQTSKILHFLNTTKPSHSRLVFCIESTTSPRASWRRVTSSCHFQWLVLVTLSLKNIGLRKNLQTS